MTVLVSGDDKALSLAKFFAGGVDRVGNVSTSDPRVITGAARYHVRVIDLSNIQGADPYNHDKFAEASPIISALGRGLKSEEVGKAGIVDAATAVTKAIVNVPAAIAGEPTE